MSAPRADPLLLERNDGSQEVAPSLRSLTQTVRVDIRKLDHLMNIVGELSIVRSSLSRIAERLRGEGSRQLATELMRLHRNFDRRLGEMQDGILEVRMVPLARSSIVWPAWCGRSAAIGEGDSAGHHRRRNRNRQADRGRAERPAHAHDPKRHRSRHRGPPNVAPKWASRWPEPSPSTPFKKAITS